MQKLNEIVCGSEGKLYEYCDQIERIDQPRDKRIFQSLLYLMIGLSMRYVIPLLIYLFHVSNVSYPMVMSFPFITLVGYLPIYVDGGNTLFLVLNILLCVAFYIYAFISVGFDAFTPLILEIIFSIMTYPSLPMIIQIIGIFANMIVNLIPWEIIILVKKTRKNKGQKRST